MWLVQRAACNTRATCNAATDRRNTATIVMRPTVPPARATWQHATAMRRAPRTPPAACNLHLPPHTCRNCSGDLNSVRLHHRADGQRDDPHRQRHRHSFPLSAAGESLPMQRPHPPQTPRPHLRPRPGSPRPAHARTRSPAARRYYSQCARRKRSWGWRCSARTSGTSGRSPATPRGSARGCAPSRPAGRERQGRLSVLPVLPVLPGALWAVVTVRRRRRRRSTR